MSWSDPRGSGGRETVMSATFMPGDDEFYMPHIAPPLQAPEPQRINPEMSNQIADGLNNMDLSRNSTFDPPRPDSIVSRPYSTALQEISPPHLSPFPKLVNPPPNVPPSDDELEARLENARIPVLNSNDPDMQLAWATDALVYTGVCSDEADRLAAAKPSQARPITPRIEHQLKQDAMNIVTFLADQHHPRAEFLRGMWLEWGRYGQREDKKEAFRCYSRAADRGFARAEYRIGMLYESYNDPAKALRHYHRGVEAGDAASCYRLGMMTLRGQHGQQQDFGKGIDLIRQSAGAADENAAQGAYVYGMLLARQLPQIEVPDHLLPYDEKLARENIEKAAYMKFAKAQAKLGSMYELGALGCDFDPALSMHYNALASKQGEADADMALSKWFLVGADKIFPKNEELAYTYAERAAQTGLPTAEFALGYFHEIGMHVPVNLEKAEEWYEKAAKHGNEDAKSRLDGLAKKNVLSKKDHENVAIHRIRSQHDSMRAAQRPERFRQKQEPSLSQVPEQQPQYAAAYPPYAHAAAAASPLPPRGTTPYPEDNNPPRFDPRPASVAPYPTSEGPPRIGGGPAGGFFNVQPLAPRAATTVYSNDPRTHSASTPAFTFHPDQGMASNASLPPNSARPMYPNSPMYPPANNASAPHLRPYEQRHASTPHLSSGPPTPAFSPAPGGLRPLPAGQRITSGPPNLQHLALANSSTTSLQPARLRPHSSQTPVPDIGFAAPADTRPPVTDPTWNKEKPSRTRRKSWVSASQIVGTNDAAAASTPNLNGSGASASGSSRNSQVSSLGSSAGGSSHTSAASAVSAINAGGRASAKPTAGGRGGKDRLSSRPAPSPAPPSGGSGGGNGGPGKGPKTFEEMGVPAHNQDKECVIM
ncbi:unnamed protein product [Zymoseptoria tritici ST99CH_1E4]|uniref:HCP-like protein n=1 Tax=Zymoseptoria tritici ST99CH_1E4 TaxID=1276532 RepID=A0A2H1H3F0_ZYMTR|nr:unnamed protein product [Zymoseptoria tritici ST99CH_1E4]